MRLIRIAIACVLVASFGLPLSTVLAQEVPAQAPQPLNGQASYAENCAPCHGDAGKGDGPSASGLSVPPTALADDSKIAARSFVELFEITKNGNMQRMMPPWGGRLTDQEIWDTVGYAWSLHTSRDEVDQGRVVYEAQCASCHGPDGKGVSSAGAPDLTDFSITSQMSQTQWAQSLARGKGAMPAFADRLSDTEQHAVLTYVRSLSLAGPLFRAALTAGTGVISGTVTNKTTGQPVPGLDVELGIFDEATQLETRTATTDAAGLYRFAELPTDATLAYAVRTAYPADVPYSSDFVSFEAGKTGLDLPLSVYETTTDPAGIRAERIHYIVEFSGGFAVIAELMVFSLDGDRAYAGDGNHVLRFSLPAGAQDLAVNEGELGGRFVQIDGGFVDRLALPPGQNVRQVLFRYALPYTGTSLDLVRSLPYPAANVNALISDVGQTVSSSELAEQGKRTAESGSYYNLVATGVPANQEIRISMTGLPSATGGGVDMTATSGAATTGGVGGLNKWIIAGLMALAAAAAAFLVAVPILRAQGNQVLTARGQSDASTSDALIDAMAELDLSYEAGEIPESAYRDQRLRLKARLRDFMRKEAQE